MRKRQGRNFKKLLIVLCLGISLLKNDAIISAAGIPYRVTIEGINDQELQKILEAISDMWTLQKKPPASKALLHRRINHDIKLFIKALRSQGFYSNRVSTYINTATEPLHVTFQIDPGPPFLLKNVTIQIEQTDKLVSHTPPQSHDLSLVLEKPAKSTAIIDAEKKLVSWFQNQGYPFPTLKERKVIVDHADKTVSVIFCIDLRSKARFGKTQFNGLSTVDEKHLLTKIPWAEGDLFNVTLFEEARKKLNATGYFVYVQVKAAETIDGEGRLPVIIVLKERKHRTAKAGISYQTDKGVGGKVFWEHRNVFHRGEHLSLATIASETSFAAEGGFRKPDFLDPSQKLLLSIRLAEDRPNAFISRNFSTIAQVTRLLSPKMDIDAGIGFKADRTEQLGETRRSALLMLPVRFNWDASNDVLDPTNGGKLFVQCTPFFGASQGAISFLKSHLGYSRYFQLYEKPFVTLASRCIFGSITGAGRNVVPPGERFYAGGGGSIRGYEYQSVGPLRENDPIGGKSLLELAVEFRTKVTNNIGLVVFFEGGSAFTSVLPDFSERLRWGAGGGLRYFTGMGPLRFDVGIPVNRRTGIDDPFQIYVSLGQAF